MEFGNSIIKLRKQRGLSQGDLAGLIPISQTYLSQVELNKKKPSLDLLEKISKALSIPLYYLTFKAMDTSDINPDKIEIHKQISPVIDSLMQSLIAIENIKNT